LQTLIKQAEVAGTKVLSVMTDRNGTAYFTDLVPGTYIVSSLLPAEIESSSVVWNCEVQVKTGDLATENSECEFLSMKLRNGTDELKAFFSFPMQFLRKGVIRQ